MPKWTTNLAMFMKEFIRSPYAKAAGEMLFIWFFSSIVPVLVLWFIGALTNNPDYQSLGGFQFALSEFFIPTEIYVYTTAILAPSVAFMIFHWRASRNVDWYNAAFLLIAFLIFTSVLIYALEKSGAKPNPKIVGFASYIIYVLSLVCWYLLLVFEIKLDEISAKPKKQSGDTILDDL